MKLLKRSLYPIICGAAAFALITAYILEIFFERIPCELCIYQRITYLSIFIFSLIAIFNRSRKAKFYAFIFIIIGLVIGLAISVYHMGVENHIFTSACSSDLSDSKSLKEFVKRIENNPIVSCDQSSFQVLGLTLVTWNFIYQMILLAYIIIVKVCFEKRNSKNVSARRQNKRAKNR